MRAMQRRTPVSPWRWRLLALTGIALLVSGGFAGGRSIAASSPRVGVPGSRPSWATLAADAGPVSPSTVLDARVYLAGRDPAGLAVYATQVSEPGNRWYAHYLTPEQYQHRFGPTATQVNAVRQWLTGAGMDVTAVTDHYVAVRGTASAAAAAFGTSLDAYRVAGASQRAPRAQVSIPAAVAPAVLTVTGLSTSSGAPGTAGAVGDTSGAGRATPSTNEASPASAGTCSAYWGQDPATTVPPAYGHTLDYDLCGYVPAQLRAAYGVSHSGLTGRGVTIAIVDPAASSTITGDVNTYAGRHGGQPLRPGQLTQYLPSDIAQSCPSTSRQTQGYHREETMDVEAALGMAPDSDIAYVGADCPTTAGSLPDPGAMLDAETRIVDARLADIVSNSWPLGTEAQLAPGVVAAYEQVFVQGAVEGIGFYFSSGDQGDWSRFTADHQPAVQFPASDPWVTSVGGTSLATGPDGSYRWETGWGDDVAQLSADGTSWSGLPGTFVAGSGGGASSLFRQPFYQRGVVPASLSEPGNAAGPMRVMPDIAADADPATSMVVGLTTLSSNGTAQFTEVAGSGTSLATPLIAGIQADAQQARHGVPIGFADPAIYDRYGTAAYHDVTDQPLGPGTAIAAVGAQVTASGGIQYGAITLGQDTSLHATIGYDDVTGVGTPTARYLSSYRLP